MMKPSLPFHEWLIICLLIVTLLLLSFVTLLKKPDVLPSIQSTHELASQTIQVTVKGAVTHEGVYEVKKGARLKELLELCQPLPEADLSRLKLHGKLKEGQSFKIPFKEWMTIHLEGAVVKPGPLKVLKGIQLKELSEKIEVLPEADLEKLQKARRLKDQEVVTIPTKKLKKVKAKSKGV